MQLEPDSKDLLQGGVKVEQRSSHMDVHPPVVPDVPQAGLDKDGPQSNDGKPWDGIVGEHDEDLDGDAGEGPVHAALIQSEVMGRDEESASSIADVYLLAVVAGCSVAALCGLIMAAACWYRLHKKVKDASSVEYPAYGVTGPAKEKTGSPGDCKLAQSAQMYHYQHQKQQMIASERLGTDVNQAGGGAGASDAESEEECEEGEYTVFECPGLATAGEMEVRNPLFSAQTPVLTPADNGK
jgi:hypothetical protein